VDCAQGFPSGVTPGIEDLAAGDLAVFGFKDLPVAVDISEEDIGVTVFVVVGNAL